MLAESLAEPGTQLVVEFVSEDLTGTAQIEDPSLAQVSGRHFYIVDEGGFLQFPGTLPEVSVRGMTSEEIELRLSAEPAFQDFDVSVRILSAARLGLADLEPFGYDVFGEQYPDHSDALTGPVPETYILGAGDTVRIQFFGNTNQNVELDVNRDGILNVPEIGPITVAGLTFSALRAELESRVSSMLIGTSVSVTMGQLHSIRVFVLGDVVRPGSYGLDSQATISSALYAAEGISEVGSLRSVELKRNGETVGVLDLYDLLLNGNTARDLRLQSGDSVFIPPVGEQVTVHGAVRRPAIYELAGRTTVADILRLAGGMLPDAYPSDASIQRVDSARNRVVISADMESSAGAGLALKGGDVLFIPKVLPVVRNAVTLLGHVERPGAREWSDSMRLVDLFRSGSVLKPGADTGYLLIKRELGWQRSIEVFSADLAEALDNPTSDANILLNPRDVVHVFSQEFGRQRVVEPLLRRLGRQTAFNRPTLEVSVMGAVAAPGPYPLEAGMRVSDLLRAGGGLTQDAYVNSAELVRYSIDGRDARSTEIQPIDLRGVLEGRQSADLLLQPFDSLRVSKVPEWNSLLTVSLSGEVRFPGEYRIRRGESLKQLVDRAGGLTDDAFAEGAIFLREQLKDREQDQIDSLADRLEADITSMALQSGDSNQDTALDTGRDLLNQLRDTEAVGRLVIDLDAVLENANGRNELVLRDGDRLLVPKRPQSVTVIGETQQNTSHLYRPGFARDDYIALSGGLTRRADKRLIYVVRASGTVVVGSASRWFGRSSTSGVEIRPGDTIVVPIETDRVRPMRFWAEATQILYQLAIAVAAVDTFAN